MKNAYHLRATMWLVLLLTLAASRVTAQSRNFIFTVLAKKGTVEINHGENWESLKVGSDLSAGSLIRFSADAYLGLLYNDGHVLEIRETGTFKTEDLILRIKESTSVFRRYSEFIFSTKRDPDKKNRLAFGGATYRGTENINVLLPDSPAEVFQSKFVLRWKTNEIGPFHITLKNLTDQELISWEINDYIIRVDLQLPELKKEKVLFVTVASKDGKKSSDFVVRQMIVSKRKQLMKQMKTELKGLDSKSSLEKYLWALVYEKNDLLLDALTCYEDALRLDPENPTFRQSYESFLLRNGFQQ